MNSHSVEHHDWVIIASDGVFDNLYDEDVRECLGEFVGEAACCLAEKSRLLGLDK